MTGPHLYPQARGGITQFCHHFPEPWGTGGGPCPICRDGITEPRARKADNWWIESATGLRPDAGDVLTEGITVDAVCPRCFTSRGNIGCSCSRAKVFQDDIYAASTFANTAVEEATILGVEYKDKDAYIDVMRAFKRASRRVDWDSDEERQDIRLDLQAEHGVINPLKTQWFQPRVVEPTHLPI